MARLVVIVVTGRVVLSRKAVGEVAVAVESKM